jgi:hypothetical protein
MQSPYLALDPKDFLLGIETLANESWVQMERFALNHEEWVALHITKFCRRISSCI